MMLGIRPRNLFLNILLLFLILFYTENCNWSILGPGWAQCQYIRKVIFMKGINCLSHQGRKRVINL